MAIGFPVAIFVVMRIELLVNCFSLIINALCEVRAPLWQHAVCIKRCGLISCNLRFQLQFAPFIICG